MGLCFFPSTTWAGSLLTSWEFNGGDVSGNSVAPTAGSVLGLSNPGRFTGQLQADAAVSGGALQLDGAGDYLQFGSNLGELRNLGIMTVSAWVKPGSTAPDYRRIVEHEDNFYFWQESGRYRYTTHGSGSQAVSTTAPSPGDWQHVLAVYEAGQPARMYVDGTPVEDSSNTDPGSMPDNAHTFQIGARRDGDGSGTASNFFHGELDDASIWSRALDEKSIDRLAGSGYARRTTPTALAGAVMAPDGTPNAAHANFQVWLKADAEVYADSGGTTPANDGQAVLRWDDQTGNGHHAERYGTNGDLTYETGEIGGQATVSFQGGNDDDFLQIPNYEPADDDDLTVFVVAKADTQTSGGSAIRPLVASGTMASGQGAFTIAAMRGSEGGSANLGYVGRGYNPGPYVEYTSTSDSPNFGDGAGHVISLELSGATGGGNGVFTGFYDGLTKESHAGQTADPANGPVLIGGDPAAGQTSRRFAGDIAEVLIYDTALAKDDRFRVTDYLNQKYEFVTPRDIRGDDLMFYASMDTFHVDSTTAYDYSGNERHGTLEHGLTHGGDAGQLHTALDFAGGANNTDSEYIDLSAHVDDFANLSEGSFSAWIRSDGASPGVILGASDQGDGSSELRFFVVNSGSNSILRLDGRNDGTSIGGLQGTTDLADGVLHHVMATVDSSGNAALYVDGMLESTATGMGFFDDVAGLDTMGIGRSKDATAGGGQWFFDGLIDDLAIWNRALSVQEVQHIYIQGRDGTSAMFVPEPSTFFLFVLGLAALLVRRRRRP